MEYLLVFLVIMALAIIYFATRPDRRGPPSGPGGGSGEETPIEVSDD